MPENKKDDLFEQYGFSTDKSKSDAPDFGGFLSGDPITVVSEPVETVEEYIAPADAPVEDTDPELNYMANMQNMFKSLARDTTEAPVDDLPDESANEDPEPELSSYLLGKPGDVPVKSQTDLLSSETQPFRDAPFDEAQSEELPPEEKGASPEPGSVGSEQQMSTQKKKPVEKGDEYWSFVDSLLDNFDDTKAAAPRPRTPLTEEERAARRAARTPRVTAEEAAAAVAKATAPVAEEPAVTASTRTSTATEAEAKSSGEAPAAGGYFLSRSEAKEANKAARHKRGALHLSEPTESVLPVVETPAAEAEPVFETEAPAVEAPVVETPVADAAEAPAVEETIVIPAVEETPVEAPVVETPEFEETLDAPIPDFDAPEEPVVENQFFKKRVETVEEEEDVFFAPAADETVEMPVVEAPVDAPVAEAAPAEPVPTRETGLTKAELKAQKKAEKQAAKEAKAAEKAAAKEAKAAEKESKAAEKAAEKEAKAAEKAAAKDAPAPWEDAEVEHISIEEALADAPGTAPKAAAAAAAAAVAEFDENARNAEFDATYVEPKKPGGALRVIRNIVITLAALAIVACIAVLGYTFAQQKLNARQFTQASTLYADGQKVKDLEALQAKYPDVTFPEDMDPALGELYAQNQDLVGWLSVKGTGIDFPVVQTKDDSFYQNHNFTKASSPYGTPFLSFKNDASDLDLNNVIYGQNSEKEPKVFGELEAYRSADYFKKHPVITYRSLSETYKFKVYGVFVTGSAADQDNGYLFDYTVPNLGTVNSFAGYIDQINQRRLYDTGVDIESTDKMLTLSTFTNDFDGARLVVVARLVRDGEASKVDTSLVKKNKSPRYPQAWYDAAGKENPFKDAVNWIPTIS